MKNKGSGDDDNEKEEENKEGGCAIGEGRVAVLRWSAEPWG